MFFPFVLGISSLSFTTGIVYLTSMLLTKHNSSGAQSFGRELGMFRTIKERALSTISGKFFWSKRKCTPNEWFRLQTWIETNQRGKRTKFGVFLKILAHRSATLLVCQCFETVDWRTWPSIASTGTYAFCHLFLSVHTHTTLNQATRHLASTSRILRQPATD